MKTSVSTHTIIREGEASEKGRGGHTYTKTTTKHDILWFSEYTKTDDTMQLLFIEHPTHDFVTVKQVTNPVEGVNSLLSSYN